LDEAHLLAFKKVGMAIAAALLLKLLRNLSLTSVDSRRLLEREDLASALADWTFASRLKGCFSPHESVEMDVVGSLSGPVKRIRMD
jgi:hypothetical protein